MTKTHNEIANDLRAFLASSYPAIKVRVEPFSDDPSKTAIYFIEPKFALNYPLQRFHHVRHLIPVEYENHIAGAHWFVLAPGESPEDLIFPTEEELCAIRDDVMLCLSGSGFFAALDEKMYPSSPSEVPESCYGDYRVSKSILPGKGFPESDFFDVFHVLMNQGGYCDCEILYNVAAESRLKSEYWKARADGRVPYDPHRA